MRKLTWMVAFEQLVRSQGLPPFLKGICISWRDGFMFVMCMLCLMFGFVVSFLACLPSLQMPVQVSKQTLYYGLNMSPVPAFMWHLVGTNNFCLSARLRNLRFSKRHLRQSGSLSLRNTVRNGLAPAFKRWWKHIPPFTASLSVISGVFSPKKESSIYLGKSPVINL